MSNSVIIGIGNDFRADDAAGLVAARKLRRELSDDITVVESNGEVTGLLEYFTHSESISIIDAIHIDGFPELRLGNVLHINALLAGLRDLRFRASTHVLGVIQAVELARALGPLPKKLEIFAIAASDFSFRKGLSQTTTRGVQQVVKMLLQEFKPKSSTHNAQRRMTKNA